MPIHLCFISHLGSVLCLSLDEGSDCTAPFKTHYKEVLKKHGAVSVEVLRALFVGPSGAWKSSLCHLLVHGKSKDMMISTPVVMIIQFVIARH